MTGKPARDESRRLLADALYAAERWEETRTIVRDLSLKNSEDVGLLGRLGALAARLGDREEARRIADRLKAVDRPFLFGGPTYDRARIAALLGDRDGAVSLLREAFAQGHAYGIEIHCDPDLETLRDYGPFQELLRPKS